MNIIYFKKIWFQLVYLVFDVHPEVECRSR